MGISWAYCVLDKPEKLQANFSLKHCHVFSHTAPPTCAKNLSNYLPSGKPCLTISSSSVLADCSLCCPSIQQPADLSVKHYRKFSPNHICPIYPIHPLLWGSSIAQELSGAGPAFYSNWQGSFCPQRAAGLTWDFQVPF